MEDKLKNHTNNIARVAWLDVEIERIAGRIEACQEGLSQPNGTEESDATTIESMVFRRSVDGMPSGTSGPGSKVESIALSYKGEQDKLRDPESKEELAQEIRDLRAQKERYKREKKDLECEINCILALMKALTRDERFVLEKQYFEGLQWRYISVEYMKAYGEAREERTLQGYRQRALDKMEGVESGKWFPRLEDI